MRNGWNWRYDLTRIMLIALCVIIIRYPFLTPDTGTSTAFVDICSISHLTDGLLMYVVTQQNERFCWWWHIAHEVYENSPTAWFASGSHYTGDTLINTIGDHTFFMLGVWMAKRLQNSHVSLIIGIIGELFFWSMLIKLEHRPIDTDCVLALGCLWPLCASCFRYVWLVAVELSTLSTRNISARFLRKGR
jgi:hypothetical protein